MLVYEGLIQAPHDGEYRFTFQSEGPIVVRLHDSLLADGSYGQQAGAELTATAILQAGFHPVRIYLLQDAGSNLDVRWQVPGGSLTAMTAADFYHE